MKYIILLCHVLFIGSYVLQDYVVLITIHLLQATGSNELHMLHHETVENTYAHLLSQFTFMCIFL